MDEAQIVGGLILKAGQDRARVLQPGKQAPDFRPTPIKRWGHAPVSRRARVAGTRVTSYGAAEAVWAATGRPWRSATATSFVPLPRLVAPPSVFFAPMKGASLKHSLRSTSPRVRTSSASASKTPRRTPARTHCWKRRWHVWYGGNRSGQSCPRAPERRIHKIPLCGDFLPFWRRQERPDCLVFCWRRVMPHQSGPARPGCRAEGHAREG